MHIPRPLAIALFLLGSITLSGETIRLDSVKDAWVSDSGKERDTNMGAARSMKIKYFQELGLIDFDVSALKGKRIKSATLYVKPDNGGKFKLNDGTDLRWLSLSTLSHDWVEGNGTDYSTDNEGNGVTFNESSFKKQNWGFPGARLWDITFGNGNSLRCEGELKKDPKTGFHGIPIDPRIVTALAVRAGYGISVLDGSTHYSVNCTIFSREAGKQNAPFILADVEPDAAVPDTPTDLAVFPAPNFATADQGAVWITLTVPERSFAYFIKLNGESIPRFKVPFAADAGLYQSFVIDGLAPDSDITLEMTIVSLSGIESAPITVTGRASPALTVPTLPAPAFTPQPGAPLSLGGVNIWAFPEVVKIHPVRGEWLYETDRKSTRLNSSHESPSRMPPSD